MTYTIYFAENSNNLDADGFLKMCQSNPDDVSTDSEYDSGDIGEDLAVARLLSQAFCRGWALMDDYAAVIVRIDMGKFRRIWSGNCTDPDLVKAYNALLTNNNN